MDGLIREDIEKLTDIDEELALMEDYIKGEDGDTISEIRTLIQKLIFK